MATTTVSVTKDNSLWVQDVNGVWNDGSYLVGTAGAGICRGIFQFILPTSLGTITEIKIDINAGYLSGAGGNFDIQAMTRDWGETTATWNKYDGTNTWTTAGGDFSATVIDTVSVTSTGIKTFYLTGANATNPITATWGDTVMLVLRRNGENTDYVDFNSRTGTTPPVITITYTPPNAPTVTTQAVSDIVKTTATGNGNVTADGGATITERGTCIGTSSNPTTAGTKFTTGGTTGAFTTAMTSLTKNTHYYVRAYAVNSAGTSYGSNVEFDTLNDTAPTVTSSAATNIRALFATGNGNVTADGGATVTERGIAWNTSASPTKANNYATTTGTTGAFSVDTTKLIPGTLYYVAAYAINSVGTTYSSDQTFTTLPLSTNRLKGRGRNRAVFTGVSLG